MTAICCVAVFFTVMLWLGIVFFMMMIIKSWQDLDNWD
jgi:hypothetical protein